MVMFVCNSCGETLKKPKVEFHCRYKCRSCDSVSCMDCGKDFWGNDYEEHYKCISEQEKYTGTPTDYKGDRKQEQWVANVAEVLTTYKGNPRVKNLLNKCITFSNLPRKQKKFVNFVKSSFRESNKDVVDEAWSIIEKASIISKEDSNGNENVNTNKTDHQSSDKSAVKVGDDDNQGNEEEEEESGDEDADLLTSSMNSKSSSSGALNGDRRHSQQSTDESEGKQNDSSDSEEEDKEEEKMNHKNANEAKLKKKKSKEERKQQLASLQNAEGKKLSKKQLKRLREESISVDLVSEGSNANHQNGTLGSAALLDNSNIYQNSKKDKKNKKKQREHRESCHEVIVETAGEDPEDVENHKTDVLSGIRLDDKLMEGVPKNSNLENSEMDSPTEKPDRHFNWHKAIKSALKAEEDGSLPVKKLRKKVLAEFMTHGGDCKIKNENEIYALFDKKLHSYPKAKILKDRVTLLK